MADPAGSEPPGPARVGGERTGDKPAVDDATAPVTTAPVTTAPVLTAPVLTAGPNRIVCNASFCQLGSGARPKERYRIIVSGLPPDEIRRLQECTGVAKPCIVSIDGIAEGATTRIIATAIHWQD